MNKINDIQLVIKILFYSYRGFKSTKKKMRIMGKVVQILLELKYKYFTY